MTAAAVTVAVVSWNTRALLERCLRSLEGDARAVRAQVWVVDNGSSDGSRELVRSDFAWARLQEAEENLGFGRAVNLVARETESEWIAPANADIELIPGALERLLATGASNPGAGAIAPRLLLPDGSTQHSVYTFPTVPAALVLGAGLGRLSHRLGDRFCLLGRWDPERAREVDWAVGAFMLVRREAFDAAGGFDERQWLFAEDLDLGWRLRRAGWRTRYDPGATVHHNESAATGAAFGAGRTARTMEATYDWMVRRRGPARTIAVAGIGALRMVFEYLLGGRSRRERARFWLGIHGAGVRRAAAAALRR